MCRMFPDNWKGSLRVGDCSRPAIWKSALSHIDIFAFKRLYRKQGQLVKLVKLIKLVNPHWATDVKPRGCPATLNLADFAGFDWQHWARDKAVTNQRANMGKHHTPWSSLHARKGHAPGIAQTVVVDRAEEALLKTLASVKPLSSVCWLKKMRWRAR